MKWPKTTQVEYFTYTSGGQRSERSLTEQNQGVCRPAFFLRLWEQSVFWASLLSRGCLHHLTRGTLGSCSFKASNGQFNPSLLAPC